MSKIQEALGKLQQKTTSERSSREERSGKDKRLLVGSIPASTVGELWREARGPEVSIDYPALRKAGLVPPEDHERELAGQYREIKRPLIANAYGKRVAQVDDGRLIAVSSSIPGEGKTFTCLNLALSIAQEQDHSVLLIDGDVAKPQVSEVMGLGGELGLLDLLQDHTLDPIQVVSRTNIKGLAVMPAGKPRHQATELLSSSRMEEVIRHLAAFDEQMLIVFDTPPLLRTSEAKVLASLVGQVVLVVKSESTPQGAVLDAVNSLSQNQAVNLLLNQSMSGSASYTYGYAYNHNAAGNFNAQPIDKTSPALKSPAGEKRGLWE